MQSSWAACCFTDKIGMQPNGNRFYLFFREICCLGSRWVCNSQVHSDQKAGFWSVPPLLASTPCSANAGDPDLPSATATANFSAALSIGAVYGRDLSDTMGRIKPASSHRICEPREEVWGFFYGTFWLWRGPDLCFHPLEPLRTISSSPPTSTDNSASKWVNSHSLPLALHPLPVAQKYQLWKQYLYLIFAQCSLIPFPPGNLSS